MELNEKAKSKAQQRFFGMVRATQKGEMENPSPEVSQVATSMSKSDVKKMAKTKHKGLPEKKKVEEGFKTQYKDKSKLSQSSQRKSLGRGSSIKDGAKKSGYESKKEHRDTSKKLAKYQTPGTYNAHMEGVMDIVRKYNKKKEEKKPQKAMDAGAKARRILQRREYKSKVSSIVPSELEDHKTWVDFKKHIDI